MKELIQIITQLKIALDTTLLLCGFKYIASKIGPDKKYTGLIAQEKEFIIPDVVSVHKVDNINVFHRVV